MRRPLKRWDAGCDRLPVETVIRLDGVRFLGRYPVCNALPIPNSTLFAPGQVMLLTLSSGPRARRSIPTDTFWSDFLAYKLSREDLSGRLVFGTNAAHIDPWSGELLGLAVYDRELQPSQAAEHYQAWNAGRPAWEDREDGRRALFLCDERIGKVVHNLYPQDRI